MRTAAKRDLNEKRLIEYLRRVGATVVQINQGGVPDLLVGFHGINLLFEVKGPKGKLTEDQKRFFLMWTGQKAVVQTIKDIKEVLKTLMPVYVYKCGNCGAVVELRQNYDDPPKTLCSECNAKVTRSVQRALIIFKGKGFTKNEK